MVHTCARMYRGGSPFYPLIVVHFTLTKNLSIVTPQGEVFTGPLGTEQPSLLSLKRISNLQQAKKVFTDYKANNMAVIQTVHW